MARSSISAVNVLESRYTRKKHTHSCLMCCNIRIAQRLVSRIFNNLNKSQSQAGEAEMYCSPHHPQWWNTACRRNTHTHPYAHALLFTQNTLIRMRAGGSPFPLWYRDRQAHSDTRTEYLVCNRIRRNLKAQKHSHGAYRHRGGNKLRNSTNKSWGTANTSTSSLSHHFSCFTQTVSLTAGFKLCSVFWLLRGGTYVATGTPSWCGCVLSSPPDSTRCWQ